LAGKMVRYGRRMRRSYSRINEVLELPNLIEIQQKSYQWFLEEGLREMFQDISPIEDFTGNLSWSSSITAWENRSIRWRRRRSGMSPMRRRSG